MFYKVWNIDAAAWVMGKCKMCRAAANALADYQEKLTGDAHIIVRDR